MKEKLIIKKSKFYNLRYRMFLPLVFLMFLILFLYIEKELIGQITILILILINLTYIVYIFNKKFPLQTPNIVLTEEEIIFNYDSDIKKFNYEEIKIKIGWNYSPSGIFDFKQEYEIYSLDKKLLHSEYISYYDITEFEFRDYILNQSNKEFKEIFIDKKITKHNTGYN